MVESELGCPLEQVFSKFDEKPIASASLGQVHKAVLRETGETVVVKVQHRFIKEQVPGDLNYVQIAVDIGQYFFPDFNYQWLPKGMKRDLPRELDYQREAANCRRCEKNFAHDPRVKVPKVYDKYTRERVLTMSYEVGTPVTHVKKMREQGIDLKELSQLISEVFNHMIFKAGFVHADPHPGNLFVRKNSAGKLEIVLLDHGIY